MSSQDSLDARTLYHCMCLMSGGFSRLVQYGKIDAIFVWGRAVGEEAPTPYDDGVLVLAADLYGQTRVPVVIPGYCGASVGQGETGYPGPRVWRGALKVLDVPESKVIAVSSHAATPRTAGNAGDCQIYLKWLHREIRDM